MDFEEIKREIKEEIEEIVDNDIFKVILVFVFMLTILTLCVQWPEDYEHKCDDESVIINTITTLKNTQRQTNPGTFLY